MSTMKDFIKNANMSLNKNLTDIERVVLGVRGFDPDIFTGDDYYIVDRFVNDGYDIVIIGFYSVDFKIIMKGTAGTGFKKRYEVFIVVGGYQYFVESGKAERVLHALRVNNII